MRRFFILIALLSGAACIIMIFVALCYSCGFMEGEGDNVAYIVTAVVTGVISLISLWIAWKLT